MRDDSGQRDVKVNFKQPVLFTPVPCSPLTELFQIGISSMPIAVNSTTGELCVNGALNDPVVSPLKCKVSIRSVMLQISFQLTELSFPVQKRINFHLPPT
ncbi:hypothetical protein CS542_09950 [Pedobacter sp. IW39]|nr:hypothetical protein CS542_09950 [Pedobacter sp. IW39]